MYKKITITALGLFLSLLAHAQQYYALDTQNSVLDWTGSYSFSFSEHTGTVSFREGMITTRDGKIESGSFIIDMTTITNPDYEARGHGPVGHLKDEDFFDVTKFTTAKLVFTKVEYFEQSNHHKIEANLTIKGLTRPITFYATADGEKRSFHARIKIDRTRWGITYNNALKNEAISDAIEFEAKLLFDAPTDALGLTSQ
ncbi:MAG: YceI family protein [Dokdonia sp.]|jgi:polyisoprenoid-binding protein YceI